MIVNGSELHAPLSLPHCLPNPVCAKQELGTQMTPGASQWVCTQYTPGGSEQCAVTQRTQLPACHGLELAGLAFYVKFFRYKYCLE